jgi:hypothetical protein
MKYRKFKNTHSVFIYCTLVQALKRPPFFVLSQRPCTYDIEGHYEGTKK